MLNESALHVPTLFLRMARILINVCCEFLILLLLPLHAACGRLCNNSVAWSSAPQISSLVDIQCVIIEPCHISGNVGGGDDCCEVKVMVMI